MKKTVQIETDICDFCGAQGAWIKCLGCGKDGCNECRKNGRIIVYRYSAHFSGSGDGEYCNACDLKLTADGTDPLHKAYQSMARLLREYAALSKDFEARLKAGEEAIKALHP